MAALRVAFVVQGEGRGHMTQALALGAFLRDAGHEVVDVLVGRSPHRPIPSYFRQEIQAPVHAFDAPVQVPNSEGRGLSVRRTLSDAVRRGPGFLRSVVSIAERTAEADVVVSFLDLMGGVSRTLFPNEVPAVAIAHNYVFLHPALAGGPGPAPLRQMVLAYARATAAGATRTVALSFDELPPAPGSSPRVAPPLLRPGLEDLEPFDGGYLLAYALNPGYAEVLAAWQRSSGVEVHCYVEGGAAVLRTGDAPGLGVDDDPDSQRRDLRVPESSADPRDPAHGYPGFHAHDLDGERFLDHLAGCRAYVGSAGFESICEAHYLGKPVLAVPTEGQFEQELNAWDAERYGAARPGTYQDLDDFWRDPRPPSPEVVDTFHTWVGRAPDLLVGIIEEAATRRGTRARWVEPDPTSALDLENG